jgi:hypothetical protein
MSKTLTTFDLRLADNWDANGLNVEYHRYHGGEHAILTYTDKDADCVQWCIDKHIEWNLVLPPFGGVEIICYNCLQTAIGDLIQHKEGFLCENCM